MKKTTNAAANGDFYKSHCAHQTPRTFGWVKATYPDAIEYTKGPAGMRGLMLFMGVFGFAAMLVLGIGLFIISDEPDWLDYVTLVMGALIGLGFLLFSIRFEFFRPEDEPTIFDRKNRKVYLISRDVHTGIKGLFKPWPLRFITYDWDLIDAQHHTETYTTGSTVSRRHALVFLVRQSPTNPTYIDQFTIGSSLILGEETVAPVWEHIRRFMEENGPHLPPMDVLAEMEKPSGWWQSMKAVFPKSEDSTFWEWLKEELPFALLIVALSPLFVPMYLIWGTGNWLSHKTAIPIKWPVEVLEAIGTPVPDRP